MLKDKANLIIIVLVTIILVISIAVISLSNDRAQIAEKEDVNIKSKILKEVIKNNWDYNYDFGKKESVFDEYAIFFDEGIEVKTVDKKVYNLVFTEKYKKNIISNVKSDSSLAEIIDELGQPDFGGKSIELIGYKYDDFYIFFNGKQASIYRNENINITEKNIFTVNYENGKEFFDNIVKEWNDFDSYSGNFNNDNSQYALINYTYKGIKVNMINDDIDIVVYNNCNTKIPENSIYNITTKNKNLIYEVETERQNSVHNREYAYEQYQSTMNNLPPDFEDSEQVYKLVQSDKFIAVQNSLTETGEYRLMFVSIDGKAPNSEIDEYITSNIWVDNYNVVYGIKDKGLYLYNVQTREKTILKEGNEEFLIHGVTNDNVLEYDNSKINVDI